jgi:hypothetical protein
MLEAAPRKAPTTRCLTGVIGEECLIRRLLQHFSLCHELIRVHNPNAQLCRIE